MTSTIQEAGTQYGDIGWTTRVNGHNTSLMLIILHELAKRRDLRSWAR